MDISTLKLEELKAMAYDELVKLNLTQKNLEIIESQIKKLSQPPQPEKGE